MLSLGHTTLTPQAAASRFRSARLNLGTRMRGGVERALLIFESAARSEAPVGEHWTRSGALLRPGPLRGSIRHVTFPAPTSRGLGIAYTDRRYVQWVIRGVSEHPITPRHGKLLVFWWPKAPGGGRLVFTPSVLHPGQRSNPFHVRAFRRVEGRMRQELVGEVRNIRFDLFR